MEIKGKLIQKLELVSGNSSNGEWKKQQYIIETDGQYPKKVCLMLWNDSVSLLDKYNIGDEIISHINIESREYNDRWYTDVKAWKIEGEVTHVNNVPDDLPVSDTLPNSHNGNEGSSESELPGDDILF